MSNRDDQAGSEAAEENDEMLSISSSALRFVLEAIAEESAVLSIESFSETVYNLLDFNCN
jgi:hypothetical protein